MSSSIGDGCPLVFLILADILLLMEAVKMAKSHEYTTEELAGMITDMLEHTDAETVLLVANECLGREFIFVEDGEYDKFVEVLGRAND